MKSRMLAVWVLLGLFPVAAMAADNSVAPAAGNSQAPVEKTVAKVHKKTTITTKKKKKDHSTKGSSTSTTSTVSTT